MGGIADEDQNVLHEAAHLEGRCATRQGTVSDGKVVVIAGPTASGKSALALAVARHFVGTVINADSQQLFAELPILTAQPTPQEQAELPHRLYGVLKGSEPVGAGRWRQMAIDAIAEAREGGRLPIVVGGTGLYLRSLMQGLSPIPDIPPQARAEAERLWRELGPEKFRALLAERDSEMVVRLQPADRQRHIRAYEVLSATGTALSQWQKLPLSGPPPCTAFTTIALLPPREGLRQAIARRFAAMLEAGALEEVARTPEAANLPALGASQLAAYLVGKMTLDQAVNLAVTATAQYAKRQHTWLRHQLIADLTSEKQLSEINLDEIFAFIRR
jgi:tRNA dimethylallyltransferase